MIEVDGLRGAYGDERREGRLTRAGVEAGFFSKALAKDRSAAVVTAFQQAL